MNALFTVCRKEIVETLRERRDLVDRTNRALRRGYQATSADPAGSVEAGAGATGPRTSRRPIASSCP